MVSSEWAGHHIHQISIQLRMYGVFSSEGIGRQSGEGREFHIVRRS
jgi:hypothetical protein